LFLLDDCFMGLGCFALFALPQKIWEFLKFIQKP
jgi:hypothetical protein